MLRLQVALVLALICCASSAYGASLEKAQALVQNHLLDDAKKELIDVLYSTDTPEALKPPALYLLAKINSQQGMTDAAANIWRELVDRYPDAPQSVFARGSLRSLEVAAGAPATAKVPSPKTYSSQTTSSGHDDVVKQARDDVHLLNDGREPRFTLQYSASSVPEHAHIWMRPTPSQSGCAGPPNNGEIPIELDMPMTITSVAGDDPQILNVHVISSATAVATKGDKIAVPIDVSFRMLRTGQVLEDAGDPDNVVPIQLARFPSIPIGVGATWEVPKEISLGSDKWAANATFTVLSVNTHSARLHFTLHLDGTLTGDGGSMRMDGSVDGTFIWRPNLFMPPGMSAALSVRGRMEGVHPDSRGDAACMQMTMGTK